MSGKTPRCLGVSILPSVLIQNNYFGIIIVETILINMYLKYIIIWVNYNISLT